MFISIYIYIFTRIPGNRFSRKKEPRVRHPTTNLVTSSDRYWLLVRRGWVLSLGGSIGVYPSIFNFYKRGGIVSGF